MKKLVFTIIVVSIVNQFLFAQTTTQNYIKKTVPVAAVSSETTLNALNSIYKIESINYIDGLGRGIQDVLVKASPNNYDIVQPTVYDQYGRSVKNYLPYIDVTNDGTFKSNALTNQASFYNTASMVAKTTSPFSETVFNNSPLNEVKEKSAPDTDWQLGNGHTTKIETTTNGNYDVLFWYLTSGGDYNIDPNHDFYYTANSLSVTKLTDANGNYSFIYTDKQGKTLCTKQFLEMRTVGSNQVPYYLTTYMVYDDFGSLTLVIPPKAMDIMETSGNYSINALTQDLVFKYKYDERHRLVEKKVPGTGWSYIVYNQLNQPVLFQDANLQIQNKWSFIKYDVLGRPIISGLFNASGLSNYQTRALAQTQFNANQTAIGESEVLLDANNPYGYTNVTLPNQNLDILTVNYYDDYDFDNNGTTDYTFNSASIPCINFNITALENLNSNMLSSVNTGKDMEENTYSAIELSQENGEMLDLLNNCLSMSGQLNEVMGNNLEMSTSLLEIENEETQNNLSVSLENETTTLSGELLEIITRCIETDRRDNENLTIILADMLDQIKKIVDATEAGKSIMRTIGGCQPYSNIVTNRTRGYLTGSRVKVMDSANPVQWEIATVFYDDKGQAIQSQSNDHMGGTDLINMVYDFVGNVINTQQIHASPGQSNIQILNRMSYDKMGRLTRVDQKNNTDFPVILTKYAYNELSQLIDKKVHSLTNGTSFLQSMDYRYNIQGWLTSINNIDLSSDMISNPTTGTNDDVDDLWGMQLNYNTNTSGINGVKQYTGNVAEKKWRSVTDNVKRAYGYDYDKVDRLKSSSYVEYNSSVSLWNSNVGKFDEKDITYDANGNIMTLKRYGFQVAGSTFGLIDNLSYQYNGNFLGSINDATTTHGQMDFKDNGSTGTNEYAYDGNGNLISNPNKGITSIIYNHLNLPTQITFNTGNKIEYTYDAAGTRLHKKVTQGATVTTKNYTGIFEYNTTNQLELMHNAEGRCVLTGVAAPQFRYEYQYTDNTGNVTMAFSDMDDNGVVATNEVIQQNHYYSFGMRMEGTNVSQIGVESKYKFSGKEFDDELGLNEYDFGARFYDPAIARWGCIDPMADAAPNWTPFRYGFNNPITVIDPTGMLEAVDWENNVNVSEVGSATGGGDDPKKTPVQKYCDEQNAKNPTANYQVVNGVATMMGSGGSTTGNGSSTTQSSPAPQNSSTSSGSSTGGTSSSGGNSNNNTATAGNTGATILLQGGGSGGSDCNHGCGGITEDQIKTGASNFVNSIAPPPSIDLTIGATEYKIGTVLAQGKPWTFTKAPWEAKPIVKITTVIRTPAGNVWAPTSTLTKIGNVVKGLGVVTGVVGLAGSAIQFGNATNNREKGEAIVDGAMGIVGFIPGGGWVVSGAYFLIVKPMFKGGSSINLLPKPSYKPVQESTKVVPRFNLKR